jgi:long-chain acyl-CoA synthetase
VQKDALMPTPKPTAYANAGAEPGAALAPPASLPALFYQRVHQWGERVALREKNFGVWEEKTWADYGEKVRACAFGLISLGLEAGERVAILSEDRYEWLCADLGAQSAGAVSVGLYATESAERCGYIIGHAEARILFVEDQEQFDKAMTVRKDLPDLRYIVVIDPKGLRHVDDAAVMTFAALLEKGRELERVQPELLEGRLEAVKPDDTVILFYTSGTTGPPKGVMHSHRSLLEGNKSLLDAWTLGGGDETLCYGPLCHIGERLFSLVAHLQCGHTVNFAESPDTIFSDMKEVAPTVFFGFPRTWERLKARVDVEIHEATWGKRLAYRLAFKIGQRRCRDLVGGRPLPLWLKVLWLLAGVTVLGKLRQRLGLNRARIAGVGGAPIAPEVLVFFQALGIPLYEGYGQSETLISVWTPDGGARLGSAGTVLPGMEFRLDDEGEILCKTPGLLQGYFKNEKATAEAMVDGFFRSGDIGHFDADGYLFLTGRAKDMIITAMGRNVAPQNLENMLKASDYIMDAVIIGEKREYLTALVALDEETVSHYAQRHGIPFSSHADLAAHADIKGLINDAVQNVNQRWSDREQILDFRILQWELSSDDDELTPTLKVRRSFICEQFADLIEEMYQTSERI